jgi:hypothetical protein
MRGVLWLTGTEKKVEECDPHFGGKEKTDLAREDLHVDPDVNVVYIFSIFKQSNQDNQIS